jgi:hypothetical protein
MENSPSPDRLEKYGRSKIHANPDGANKENTGAVPTATLSNGKEK